MRPHHFLLIGYLLFGSLSIFGEGSLAGKRPNILLIVTDDQGMKDVGCYGSEIPTPNIDALASDGAKFTRWYSASSICTPSRFGMLTGRNPSRSRDQLLGALMFLAEDDKKRGLRRSETTVATALKTLGYDTALIGKWHLGHGSKEFWPTQHGFDYFYGHTAGCIDFFTMSYGNTLDWYRNETLLDEPGYATDLLTADAIRFLKQKRKTPFFLLLAYNAPHFGKGWNDGENETVNLMQPHPRDLERVRTIKDPTRRKFAAKTVGLDRSIGEVMQVLDEEQLSDKTLVVFMTDHGGDSNYGGANEPFRNGKATLFEGGIRVPCLMRWPKVIPRSLEVSAAASALDFFPSFLDLAGADSSRWSGLDGESFLPLLKGETGSPRSFYWGLGEHLDLQRARWEAFMQGEWKYVQDGAGSEYLFNLESDPYERTNLQTQNPFMFKSLKEGLQRARKSFQTLR